MTFLILDQVIKLSKAVLPRYEGTGASQVVLVVKNPPANAGDLRDTGLISGLGRSPGGGDGRPLRRDFLPGKTPRTEEPGGVVPRLSRSVITLLQPRMVL